MEHVAAGAQVVATPGCGTPETLLAGLVDRAASAPGITLSGGLLLGSHPYVNAVRDGVLKYRTWHVTSAVRPLVRSGQVDYVPARASDVPALVADWCQVLLVRVSPPDRAGYCSLGPSG